MPPDLPYKIVPGHLAEAGACIEGRLELSKMPRLVELLSDNRGMVELKLAFSRSEDGITCINGGYRTDLLLICQRCLEPFAVKLAHTIKVGVVFEGTTLKKIPASMEPLVLKQETMQLTDFIEDEILLGLPISPMHRLEDCAAGTQAAERDPVGSGPFHILKKLKSG